MVRCRSGTPRLRLRRMRKRSSSPCRRSVALNTEVCSAASSNAREGQSRVACRLDDRVHIAVVEREARQSRVDPLDEQADGRHRLRLGDRYPRAGQRQRRHSPHDLECGAERLTARRHHADVMAGREQVGDQAGDISRKVLAVVEHQDGTPPAKMSQGGVPVVHSGSGGHAERSRQRGAYQLCVLHRPQVHQPDAVVPARCRRQSRRDRQAGLAHATRPRSA